ncbi:MAG TPA: hypothetical protein VI957_03785 [Candidatus Paceibacterota bacterium]
MFTITIPKTLANKGDLIVIPRTEYKKLLANKKEEGGNLTLTLAQKKLLVRAKKDLRAGKLLSYGELGRKLGFSR